MKYKVLVDKGMVLNADGSVSFIGISGSTGNFGKTFEVKKVTSEIKEFEKMGYIAVEEAPKAVAKKKKGGRK